MKHNTESDLAAMIKELKPPAAASSSFYMFYL